MGFSLYTGETPSGTPAAQATSDAYGYVTFSGLSAGTYYVFETAPLSGYLTPEQWLLKAVVAADGTVSYSKPDGSPFSSRELMNGVAPRLENVKAATLTVEGLKYLEGRDLAEGEFTFVLTRQSDGSEVGEVSNGANGRFRFQLTFTQDLAGTQGSP